MIELESLHVGGARLPVTKAQLNVGEVIVDSGTTDLVPRKAERKRRGSSPPGERRATGAHLGKGGQPGLISWAKEGNGGSSPPGKGGQPGLISWAKEGPGVLISRAKEEWPPER